jgi:Glycosyltransferase family 28 C-terminal domain/Monogalactosyldiacylglycerol (MGDG) synthase
MPRIEFVFFDAGGGHRSAATSLQLAVQSANLPWEVHLMNLQEVLDRLDILRRFTGLRIQDFYNKMLASGWTLGSAQLLRVLQFTIAAYHRPCVNMLADCWRESDPDMVVSFIPHFNTELNESLQRVHPGRPFVTILTDLANYPPRFWIEKQRQDFICGTERALAQALESGHSPERAHRASGMILHPRFYEPIETERDAGRKTLGLSPDLPTGLILFGGHGSNVIEDIVASLDKSNVDLQLIAICGRNEKLAQSLRSRKWRMPIFVEGFTKQIPYYMHLSDFFIGKPGPGSLSEAVAMQLPVITECNSWTLPQERYNADWIREKEIGLVVRNFRQIEPAVRELLQPATLERFKRNTAAMPNRAVFEIPGILDKILSRCPPGSGRC